MNVDRSQWLWIGCVVLLACSKPTPAPSGPPTRIIALTPSVTEIVLRLGAGDRLVGVDRFSRESPDVAAAGDVSKVQVAGDFVAPNVEVIAKLQPHLVILDAAQSKASRSLSDAGYKTLDIQMHTIADIRAAVETIAEAIGETEKGAKLLAEIDNGVAGAKRLGDQVGDKVSVLWVIDREPGTLNNLIGAGPGSFADELIRMVGGTNTLTSTKLRYPKISREAIARLEVDLIIDSSGAAQKSTDVWRGQGTTMIAPLPTSAATPRPTVADSLVQVGNLIVNAAAAN